MAVVLPVALVFAVAEAVAEGVVVTVLVGVAVVLGVAVVVLVAVVLSLGLALLVVGLALVLLLAGLVTVAAGGTLGLADLVALFEGDGEELDGHAVTVTLGWLLGMLLGADTAGRRGTAGGPIRSRPGLCAAVGGEPHRRLSWMKAWRSGGTARATPTANTAQAAARAGRSSPSRQSRGWRRA